MKRLLVRLLRVLILLLILGALVGAGRALVLRKQARLAEAPVYGTRPTPVRVATARRGDLVLVQPYLAVVEPDRTANVSARVTAVVEELLCDEGDTVTRGQLLVRLDDREFSEAIAALDAQIAAAEAELAANRATEAALEQSLAYWEREAQRAETLVERGGEAASNAEGIRDKVHEFQGKVDATKEVSTALANKIDALRRQRELAETKRGYCELRSPYDGVVARHEVDPGDLAVPGKTLLVVEDRSRLKLAFQVPQADLSDIREGLPIEYDVGGERRRAELTHLYPTLDAARMVRAEVWLDEEQAEGLACGAYVPVRVQRQELRGVTLLPATALIEAPGRGPSVFVVDDDHLVNRAVEVLGSSDGEVGVRGVEPGSRVVTSTFLGWATLSSGIPVEVIR